jgi:ParB-like chromosome segregation protein Spo0J
MRYFEEKEMETVERKINDLIEAEYNPRRLTDKQRKHLEESLTRFGMVDPIVVNRHPDRDNVIVGGHQRLRVWRELGNDTIPTVEVKLEEDRERELNIRLNANTGEWDLNCLADEFNASDLKSWGLEGIVGEGKNMDAEVEKLPPPPPAMTWVLVACPTREYGKIAELVEEIGQQEKVQVETAVTNE